MAFDRRKQSPHRDFAARVAIFLLLDPMLQCCNATRQNRIRGRLPAAGAQQYRWTVALNRAKDLRR
jgi:hypothetical protein